MLKAVRIFQIKDIANTDYAFRSYAIASTHGFSLNDYVQVESKVVICADDDNNDTLILEDLFYDYNYGHHDGMHSMSISDVVAVDDKWYYCDIVGWKQI